MKALLFLMIPACFLWAHTTERQTCDRKFVVGLNNYAPFAFRENGKLQGLAHDIVNDLAKNTSCQFLEEEVPRPSSVEELKRGHLDIVMLVIKGNEYGSSGNFQGLYTTTRRLTVLTSNYDPKKTVSDYLADRKVKFAQLIGTKTVWSEEEQRRLLLAGRIIGVPDPEGAFRLLKQGRVQAVLFSFFLTEYYLKKMKLEGKVVSIKDSEVPAEVGVYYSKRRLNSDEEKMLRQALEKIKADGSLHDILVKYMGEEEASRRVKMK